MISRCHQKYPGKCEIAGIDPIHPTMGKTVDDGDPTAVVESVKAASDIYAPVSGEVIEVNPAVEADPSLVNTDPYGAGWIFKLKITKPDQLSSLLSPAAYGELIG